MISIVIPTLNEEGVLERTLACVGAQPVAHEVVISDGGSRDQTLAIARRHRCAVCHCLRPDRAAQLNLGASRAQGRLLLFLHADTQLSPGCLHGLLEAMRLHPALAGGAFSRRFESDSWVLNFTCRLADWRGRFFGLFYGDQAIFVRREVFDKVQGFRALPLFEDMDFSRRMKRHGKVNLLRPRVLSSARRFESRGPILVTLTDFWLTCRYLAGADPRRLTRKTSPT